MSNKIEDLEIYNLSDALSNKIWSIVISWDYFAKDTIGKQLVRSADSISANIAEGFGRFHYKENKNFCYFSRGSIIETKSWLNKGKMRGLITDEDHVTLISDLETIHHKLNSYIKYIGK
ncbi:four helix bundle protein [Mucilaginibacter pallidiroseus]|uniref:Four helix bundle protein n=1 Tax=Mucilaginibacter pallidiroseus TaxID=2599295 RepID=A0A563UCP7_9SPHI|nr:four helix bundle protein [Mucilaginibacter pallidiroseus]TWR29106.1 four helix bundle protein [Mucilaginibacter pallidiroseus]